MVDSPGRPGNASSVKYFTANVTLHGSGYLQFATGCARLRFINRVCKIGIYHLGKRFVVNEHNAFDSTGRKRNSKPLIPTGADRTTIQLRPQFVCFISNKGLLCVRCSCLCVIRSRLVRTSPQARLFKQPRVGSTFRTPIRSKLSPIELPASFCHCSENLPRLHNRFDKLPGTGTAVVPQFRKCALLLQALKHFFARDHQRICRDNGNSSNRPPSLRHRPRTGPVPSRHSTVFRSRRTRNTNGGRH